MRLEPELRWRAGRPSDGGEAAGHVLTSYARRVAGVRLARVTSVHRVRVISIR
jgi:hypothetical protein